MKKAIVALAAIAALAGLALFVFKSGSQPVTVTVRVAVTPKDQSQFVAGLANSMKFKYLVGKQSGVKPVLAQKLSVKALPDSPQLEAQIAVPSREEGTRYQAVFVDTLQSLCGTQAQVVLANQSIR